MARYDILLNLLNIMVFLVILFATGLYSGITSNPEDAAKYNVAGHKPEPPKYSEIQAGEYVSMAECTLAGEKMKAKFKPEQY